MVSIFTSSKVNYVCIYKIIIVHSALLYKIQWVITQYQVEQAVSILRFHNSVTDYFQKQLVHLHILLTHLSSAAAPDTHLYLAQETKTMLT
jgi:hypothetical protein